MIPIKMLFTPKRSWPTGWEPLPYGQPTSLSVSIRPYLGLWSYPAWTPEMCCSQMELYACPWVHGLLTFFCSQVFVFCAHPILTPNTHRSARVCYSGCCLWEEHYPNSSPFFPPNFSFSASVPCSPSTKSLHYNPHRLQQNGKPRRHVHNDP